MKKKKKKKKKTYPILNNNPSCVKKMFALCKPGCHRGGEGGGGAVIFSYMHRFGSFFGVQNFEFLYFWVFFRKMIIFGV